MATLELTLDLQREQPDEITGLPINLMTDFGAYSNADDEHHNQLLMPKGVILHEASLRHSKLQECQTSYSVLLFIVPPDGTASFIDPKKSESSAIALSPKRIEGCATIGSLSIVYLSSQLAKIQAILASSVTDT